MAFLRETKNIYARAGFSIRAFYDSAEKRANSDQANCVIKWLLWQALRQAECCEMGINTQYGMETRFGELPRSLATRAPTGEDINASRPSLNKKKA